MNKENAETRKKLKDLSSVEAFEEIINRTMLSEEEQTILKMHYREQKSLTYIADTLGMSESCIKKKHKKMLIKIGKNVY